LRGRIGTLQELFDAFKFLRIRSANPAFQPVMNVGRSKPPLAADLAAGQPTSIGHPLNLTRCQVQVYGERIDIKILSLAHEGLRRFAKLVEGKSISLSFAISVRAFCFCLDNRFQMGTISCEIGRKEFGRMQRVMR
jgi:hypothetical protein